MTVTLLTVLLGLGLLHTQIDAAEVKTGTNTESPLWPYDTTTIEATTSAPAWPWDTTTEPEWRRTTTEANWPWDTTTEPEWRRTTEPEWRRTTEPEWRRTTEPEWRQTTTEANWPWETTTEPEWRRTTEPEWRRTTEPEWRQTTTEANWPWDTTTEPEWRRTTTENWPWDTTTETEWRQTTTENWPWETTTEPEWHRTTSESWPWETTTEPEWRRTTSESWPWETTTEQPDVTTEDKPIPPLPIVSEWPKNITVKFGSSARIPFTFGTQNTSVSFTAAAIEAVFTGSSELKSIFWAKEGSSGIYEEFQDDFEAIPGSKHDIRINNMTLNLAGEYLARVLSTELEEEKRQFKVTTTLGEPSCRDSAYPRHVYEGDSVDLDCRLYYSGPSVPTLKWVDCHGNEMPGDYRDDGQNTGTVHHRQYRHSFTAEHKHAHCAFTCHVSFADDASYADECSTSVLVLSSRPMCNAKQQETEFGGLLFLDCSSEYIGETYTLRNWYHSGKWLRGDYVLDETVLPGDKERPAVHKSTYVSTIWDKFSNGSSEYECVAYDPITGHSSNCSLTSHIARKCHGQSFSEELCPSPYIIEIYGARDYVSVDCGDDACCPRPDHDCSGSISEADPARFGLIKKACNRKHRCESLSLHPRRIDKCDSLSDYAELYYFCVDPLSG